MCFLVKGKKNACCVQNEIFFCAKSKYLRVSSYLNFNRLSSIMKHLKLISVK